MDNLRKFASPILLVVDVLELTIGYQDADKVIAACDVYLYQALCIAPETARWALCELERLVDLLGQETARGVGARLRMRSMAPTWLEDVRGVALNVCASEEWDAAQHAAATSHVVGSA